MGDGVSKHQPHDSTVHSGADQRKHQSSTSLAFVREIHRSPVLDATGRSLCELQLQHWNKYMEESCRFQRAMLTMITTKIHTLQCYWRLNVTDTQGRWHMNSIWWKCNAINCLKNWYWFPRSFWFLFHFFQRTNSFYVRLTDGVSSPF